MIYVTRIQQDSPPSRLNNESVTNEVQLQIMNEILIIFRLKRNLRIRFLIRRFDEEIETNKLF